MRATTDLDVYVLPRDVFVPAVSGYSESSAAADATIARLLEGPRRHAGVS